MSRPSSRQSAHSAASMRSAGSFSPARASSGFGAPICGRPGASIAQYDPWLKPEWRPPLNSFKFGSAEPARVGERLLAVGDEPSKPIGVNDLWGRVDTDELAEAEQRVRLLSATWRRGSESGAAIGASSLSIQGASPEVSASWSFGQEPIIGMSDRQAPSSMYRSTPAVRTGAFRASRGPPRTFAAAAARRTSGSPDVGSCSPDVAGATSTGGRSPVEAAVARTVGGSNVQARSGVWLTTEQRAWLTEPSTAPHTAESAAPKRVAQRTEQRQRQWQRRAKRSSEPKRVAENGLQPEVDARRRVIYQERARVSRPERDASGLRRSKQWSLSL